MTKNEFKKVTKEWLISKGFKKTGDVWYSYSLTDFDITFGFPKDRFDEIYRIHVGFQLRDIATGWGYETSSISKRHKKYWITYDIADGSKELVKSNFYYEKWDKYDYLETLEEICDTHIKPYLDKGIKHLKEIVKKYGEPFEGNTYMIHPNAAEAVRNM